MLRYFYLENWKSYKNGVLLDLVATREQRDGETLARLKNPRSRILPIAALYGANAAGKSAIVQAFAALKQIVVNDRIDSAVLPVVPSRLNRKDVPTTFEIEFVVSGNAASTLSTSRVDKTYRYTLVALPREIIEESLVRVRTNSDQVVIRRTRSEALQLDTAISSSRTLTSFAETVEPNETLLRRLATRNEPGGEELREVFSWFKNVLQVVSPDSAAVQLPERLHADQLYRDAMSRDLTVADTGIQGIDFRSIPFSQLGVSAELEDELIADLRADRGLFILKARNGKMATLELKSGQPVVEELVTNHVGSSGSGSFSLSLDQESDGTVRYFNLLPMVHDLADENVRSVYVVDELDRSLHTGLTSQIIQRFLEKCSNDGRSQLIFTTHDASLMRLNLMRRDEIWFVEKVPVDPQSGDSSDDESTGEGQLAGGATADDGTANGGTAGQNGGNAGEMTSELVRLSDLSSWGIRDSTDLFNRYLSGSLPGAPRRSY